MSGILAWGDGSAVPYARRLVGMSAEGAPATIEYLVCLGVNDYFSATMFAADFGVALAAFVDSLHAQQPTATIWMSIPVQLGTLIGNNANGETLQDFADEITAIEATRVWIDAIDLRAPNAVAFDVSLRLPTLAAGQQALADNVQAAVGY
jgi:hypothetical protein